MRLSNRASVLLAAVGSVVIVSGAIAAPTNVIGFSSFGNGTAGRVNVIATATPGALGFNADNTSLKITDGQAALSTSAFTTAPIDYGTAFTASWIYVVPGAGGINANADGFTWTLQNDARGNTALGGPGGAVGYGGDTALGIAGIGNSIAAYTNLYSTRRHGFLNGGTVSTANTSTANMPVLNNGIPKLYTVTYSNGVLRETIIPIPTGTTTATGTAATYTRTLNVGTTIGSPTAYLGFTGGSGQVTADQTVSNFRFTSFSAFSPIGASGYNADLVVEASAAAGANYITGNNINATMDAGRTATGATFYERGWNGRTTSGLPMGTTITSASESGHTYALASAVGNNVVLLDNAAGNSTGRLTFSSPAAYSALSILGSSGNGNVLYNITLHFTDGTTETTNSLASMDWYDQGPSGIAAMSRINNPTAGTADAVGALNPQLYTYDVPVLNSGKVMDYVDFTYTTGTGHAAIFAISGAAVVPEPSALGLIALAPVALRRRR